MSMAYRTDKMTYLHKDKVDDESNSATENWVCAILGWMAHAVVMTIPSKHYLFVSQLLQ